ncbi:GNAT family N-acetyltransferase [Hamadaea sp. NPDC050747]|uniref:GNAT family N-acetyltransferase n=1 Tax=Hamadaea sp. NPDC050747 TaxID=3155789 RepID=UPI0033CA9F2C
MTAVGVRPATEADGDALADLRREWTEEQAGGPIDDPGYEQRMADWLTRTAADSRTWVAVLGGKPIGLLHVALLERMPRPGHPPSRWGYVTSLYVRPPHRDGGVGRRLLDELLAYAREAGLRRVVLHPSDRAVPFYERAGFAPAAALMMRGPVA